MKYTTYEHHGDMVVVREDLKGKHREHCLCFQGCANFRPGSDDNCYIAKCVFSNCVAFNIVTPVWECPLFKTGEVA